jgi:hypothetical protein
MAKRVQSLGTGLEKLKGTVLDGGVSRLRASAVEILGPGRWTSHASTFPSVSEARSPEPTRATAIDAFAGRSMAHGAC